MQHSGDSYAGLAFLATVVVAIVALLLGFGVPVGIGALAGFALGVLGGLVGALWLTQGSGRSVTIGRATWSSDDRAGGMTPLEMAQMRERGELAQIDLGLVRAVVPGLTTVQAGGYTVQHVSTEVREGGLTSTVDVRAQPGSIPPGFWADVTVRDSAGTSYRASGQSSGGHPGSVRFVITIIPAPPTASRGLEIVIERFLDPFPGAGRTTEGPWAFTVELPAPA